jgi:nitrous oxide reductase accessory protein NosL
MKTFCKYIIPARVFKAQSMFFHDRNRRRNRRQAFLPIAIKAHATGENQCGMSLDAAFVDSIATETPDGVLAGCARPADESPETANRRTDDSENRACGSSLLETKGSR